MKKSVIIPVAIVFLVVTTVAAFARNDGYAYYRPYHHHHGGHSSHYSHADNLWVALGAGLLAGCLISSIISSPPSRTVVYSSSAPIEELPPRVVVKEYVYAPSPQLIAVDKVVVTAQELNVRTGPGFNHAIAGYVVMGEALQVMGRAPGWVYVRTASGQQGWVMANYTAPQASPVG